jgi:hypothetical protein
MKTPTLKEKVKQYEAFLHKINACLISCNHEGVTELVRNADNWSYAHRVGNGEWSEKQQQKMIDVAFRKLLDTPNADKVTEERQKAWTEAAKQKEQAFISNL